MKKLIAVALVIVMFLSTASLAEKDPIVGTWYTYTGIVEDTEIRKQAYYEFSTFHFTEDGDIFTSTYDISEQGITTCKDYKVIGMWTKENGIYYVNIGLKGAVKLVYNEDSLFFPVSDYSIRVHKMTPVNYVLDIHE